MTVKLLYSSILKECLADRGPEVPGFLAQIPIRILMSIGSLSTLFGLVNAKSRVRRRYEEPMSFGASPKSRPLSGPSSHSEGRGFFDDLGILDAGDDARPPAAGFDAEPSC